MPRRNGFRLARFATVERAVVNLFYNLVQSASRYEEISVIEHLGVVSAPPRSVGTDLEKVPLISLCFCVCLADLSLCVSSLSVESCPS